MVAAGASSASLSACGAGSPVGSAGLSGAFGVGTGQGSLGGGSLVERNLNRWTVAIAIVWILVIILLVKEPWA